MHDAYLISINLLQHRLVQVERASTVNKLSCNAHAAVSRLLTPPPGTEPPPKGCTNMYEAVPSGGAPTIITPTHRNKLLMYDADDDGENDLPEDYYVECETVPHQQPDDGRQRVPGASASPSHTTYATNSGRPRIASTLVHIAERDRAHRTARHSVNNNNALANERRPLTIADADNN